MRRFWLKVKASGGGGGPRNFSANIILFEILVAFEIPLETIGQRTREKLNLRRDGLKRVGGFCIYDYKISDVIQIYKGKNGPKRVPKYKK